MIKVLNQLEDQSKSIIESIKFFDELECKPVHIGKAMEQVLSLATILMAFLGEKMTTTYDDPDLIHEIKTLQNGFLDKKEKYSLSLLKYSEYSQKIEEANEIERKHQKIVNDIAQAEETLSREESKTRSLYTEYQLLADKIKSWQDAIAEIEENHLNSLDNYKKHYQKNDQILRNIFYGQEDPRKALSTLSEEIQNKIQTFDLGLKDLIKEGKAIPIETISNSMHDKITSLYQRK